MKTIAIHSLEGSYEWVEIEKKSDQLYIAKSSFDDFRYEGSMRSAANAVMEYFGGDENKMENEAGYAISGDDGLVDYIKYHLG